MVQYLDSELRSTTANMERVHDMTVLALGAALHLRNSETESHCRRVAENSIQLGKSLDLSDAQMRDLKWGGYLHDIGKIGISEKILLKPGSLTPDEWKVVKTHAVMGYMMIENIDFLKGASEVVLYHHERFDGTGYPSGLLGKNIPLLARIFAVFDAFDAMVMGRSYKKPMSAYKARKEIARSAGTHFDPEIVEHFLGLSARDLLAA
jgi:putative nucleotidyltransferase with HDIG domain